VQQERKTINNNIAKIKKKKKGNSYSEYSMQAVA
jgi:hypothetical protein